MIPKIIHYVWVGNAVKDELVESCIASWKKYLPDYQIIEWNNEKVKDIDNRYMQEAFKAEKWAIVSDYVRLYALNKFGGFYFDTDLEIKRNLDEFLKLDFCTCYEKLGNKSNPVMTAFLAAEKGNSIIKDLMIEYDGRTFITAKGYDLTTNVHHVKKYFEKTHSLYAPL